MQQNATPENMRAQLTQIAVWMPAFILVLAEGGNVSKACEAAGIERSTAYRAKEQHPLFAAAWDEALEVAADSLEAEARRRAAEGVDEPVYQKGMLVGYVRKYSDTLLIFLLKAARPEKFRERFDHKGEIEHKLPPALESMIEKVYGDSSE